MCFHAHDSMAVHSARQLIVGLAYNLENSKEKFALDDGAGTKRFRASVSFILKPEVIIFKIL